MGNVLNTAYKVVADVIESEENINIEQGTLHVIDDKLKVHLEGEIKEVSTKSYKVYTALLTQSGTDAPVATVLENTLGGDVVWSYLDVGIYKATSVGLFTLNKSTSLPIGIPDSIGFGFAQISDENDIFIVTHDFATAISTDDILNSSFIEIRVYN